MDDIDDKKLGHELADCLWPVMILADKCGVDLVSEFQKTMTDLEARLDSSLGSRQKVR